ncbi:hypothetical protein ISS03_05220 [Patescibacteria group bacterium]|nr:hypothetical protein [Patescibacteria group bacterium]
MNKNILIVVFFFLLASPVSAASEINFDPSYIIGDSDITNSKAMSYQDVVDFLRSQNSYLANYKTENADGQVQDAAQIIYNAAVNNYDCSGANMSDNPSAQEKQIKCKPVSINPQFLLVLLQKEQSLISDKTPRASQLDWAMGYGCPDGGGCNSRWKGFGKQVNSAALQFFEYMTAPYKYSFKAGNLYRFDNKYAIEENQQSLLVRPANKATAALYNYTPHVYNGNYNLFNIWQSYFKKDLLEGSLVQAAGEAGVWLIRNGAKIPFLSKMALTSRFDENKIITVKPSDLASYVKGGAIRFPQYSVVRAPDGIAYLLVDDKKRKIASDDAFRQIGYNPEEVENASWQDLENYSVGAEITGTSAYPTGALLQNNKTGGVYWVIEGTRSPILDKVFLATKYKNKKIIQVSPTELEQYQETNPVMFDDGELLTSTSSNAVYVISEGKKRPIPSAEIFESVGFKWTNVLTVNPKVLYLYPNGEPLSI